MSRDGQMRVLIVDDQAVFREAARALLEKRGHVVAEAADGAEALAAAGSFAPDGALVAARLGRENGHGVARELTRASRGLAVLLISINATAVTPRSVRDCGARAFILKHKLATVDLVELIRAG